MKKQSNNLFTSMSKEETAELTTVVKETVATVKDHHRVFGALDLWNIHRQKRVLAVRRQSI